MAVNDVDTESVPISEKEIEVVLAPGTKQKRRGKATRQHRESDDDVPQDGPSSKPAKKSGRARAAYRTHAVDEAGEEEDEENEEKAEESEEEKKRVRSESKRKKKEVARQSDLEQEEEQDEHASQDEDDEPPLPVKKSKKKAATGDDTGVTTGKAKANRKNRANAPPSDEEEMAKTQPSKRKPASHTDYDSIPKPEKQKSRKQASKSTRDKSPNNEDEEVQQPKKKKKLFPSSQPLTFPWDDLPKVGTNTRFYVSFTNAIFRGIMD